MNTLLNEYTLWFDGMITIEPQRVFDFIDIIDSVSVTEITPQVKQYNKMVGHGKCITTKDSLKRINNDWRIPVDYKTLNIDEVIAELHSKMILDNCWQPEEIELRNNRISIEQRLFKKHNLYPLLQALFFIINTLKQKGIVWGTGRGSSVSSYILYILEVHDVDSFSFQLDITDFLK